MKTKIIYRAPASVISTGLARCKDLRTFDAVLIINPEKMDPNAEPAEGFLISSGEDHEDASDRR